MSIFIPKSIKKFIGEECCEVDTIGKSDSTVICFNNVVLKIEQGCEESDNEFKMLQWLQGKLPVPKIICAEKIDGVNYLLMSKLTGKMSCDKCYISDIDNLIHSLAEGLKLLWNIDISNCPYKNDVDNKLRLAKYRIENSLCDNITNAEPDTFNEIGFSNPKELFEWLIDNKPTQELVFSHGDYCLPNIFIDKNEISGFIDLGRSGVADKWQDIALCYRSLKHKFGEKEDIFNCFFNKLELKPDWEKINYYILLDELF